MFLPRKAWWIPYMYRVRAFIKDFWLKMKSWLLITCAFHIFYLDDYVIRIQIQQFRSFVVALIFIPVFVHFCFNYEIRKAAVFMLPSWQLDMLLHSLSSALIPSQCFPPYAGSGSVHSLFLVCIPPNGLEQILQEFHSLQPPSTNNVVNKNSWETTTDDMLESFNKIQFVRQWRSLYFYLPL